MVADCDEEPEVILISTGSEGGAVQEARLLLLDAHLQVRHVSMPCLERFEQQDLEYQIEVLPLSVFIVVVEAGVTRLWYQYADHVIGINEYGASAPGGELMERYGFTDLDSHSRKHEKLLRQGEDMRTTFDTPDHATGAEFRDFFGNWMTNHILSEDRKFGPYLNEKGVF